MSSNFQNVSSRRPCAACGRKKDCSFTEDGAIMCRRGPFDGAVEETDKNGRQYWVLQTEPGQTFGRPTHDKVYVPEAAPLGQRHRVYTEAMGNLSLSRAHRQALLDRGLVEADLANLNLKTLTGDDRKPVAARVAELFTANFQAVPGFYVKDSGLPWLGGYEGLWIPCRDLEGKIQAIRIRADNPGKNGERYSWLSKSGGGPGSGAPASWWPAEGADTSTVRLTEGELKAAVAARTSGISTISGGAGISSLAGQQIEEWLSELGPSTVLLAPDSDAWTSPDVNRAVRAVVSKLKALGEILGFELIIEAWDLSAKGVDDALQAKLEVRRVSHEDYIAALPWWPESVSATEPKPKPAKAKAEPKPKAEKKKDKEPSQLDLLMDVARAVEFVVHEGQPFGSVMVENADGTARRETYRFSRGGFRQYLIRAFRAEHDFVPSSEALAGAMAALEAEAVEGKQAVVWTRVGFHEGTQFLDLADKQGRVVKFTGAGWEVIQSAEAPVFFQRPAGMLPLPVPEPGGSIEELRPFINLEDEDSFILVVSWLLWSFFPRFSKPILLIQGPQGAAKSWLARLLRALIDPHSVALRKMPKDEEALSMAAYNTWVYVIDNLSRVPEWLSDGLCGVATGSGFSMRKLYSDNEESAISYLRPTIVTGLQGLSGKTDFLERLIAVTLRAIETRKLEEELIENPAWKEAQPRIIGAFLTAACTALRNKGKNRVQNLPRMADYAQTVSDAEPALPWAPGRFIEVYWAHKNDHIEDVLEVDPLAMAIRVLLGMNGVNGTWEGTATELCERLSKLTTDPKNVPGPQKLVQRLNLLVPNLKGVGINVESYRRSTDRRRLFVIKKITSPPPPEIEGDHASDASMRSDRDAESDNRKALSARTHEPDFRSHDRQNRLHASGEQKITGRIPSYPDRMPDVSVSSMHPDGNPNGQAVSAGPTGFPDGSDASSAHGSGGGGGLNPLGDIV